MPLILLDGCFRANRVSAVYARRGTAALWKLHCRDWLKILINVAAGSDLIKMVIESLTTYVEKKLMFVIFHLHSLLAWNWFQIPCAQLTYSAMQ